MHILVIPKGAYVSLHDFAAQAGAAEIKAFYAAVATIVESEGLNETGYRTISNSGLNGGQEVPHFHLHILGGRRLGPMLSRAA